MKNYEKPVIIESSVMFERVFAESGTIDEGTPDFSWDVTWRNHNSGSHSEMEVHGYNGSAKGGNYVSVTINFIGEGVITGVGTISKATGMSWNENSITMWYEGVYNPREDIIFGIAFVTFSESPSHGAYHLTGEWSNVPATDAFVIGNAIAT